MRKLRNLTIAVDEEVAHWARILAAEHNTSVSRLVAEMLAVRMRDETENGRAHAQAPAGLESESDGRTHPFREDQHGRPESARETSQSAVESEPLPEILRPLFWEFDFGALRWPKDRDLVIAKVLEVGDFESWLWLRSVLGRDFLRSWLIARGGRGLDPRRISFWATVLSIPEDLARRWIKALDRDPWAQRLSS